MRAARLRASAAAVEVVDPGRATRQRRVAEAVEKGNAGERLVGGLLDVLDGAGWVVLHDRYRSASSPANLDHVVVGPPGVFVVDAKNWTGERLRLDERGMALDRYRKDEELWAVRADAALVGERVAAVAPEAVTTGVLAFVQDLGLTGPVAHQGVVVLQAEQLLLWLTSQPVRLTAQQVHQLGSTLDAALPPRSGRRTPLTVPPGLARPRTAGRGVPPRPRPRPGPAAPVRSRTPAGRPRSGSVLPHQGPRARPPRRMWVVALLVFLLLGVVPAVLQVWVSLLTGMVQQVGPQLPAGTSAPAVSSWCVNSGLPPPGCPAAVGGG